MHVIIYLSNPKEYTRQRVNPNVNHGLWLIIMGQCWFINCNKCATVVELLMLGEVLMGEELCGNCLYFQLNFAINLNLL